MSDLISREELKDFINEVCFSKQWAKYRVDNGSRGQIECILTYINNAPTVSLQDYREGYYDGHLKGYTQAINEKRPQGEWINHRNDYGHNIADCSICGKAMQWHDEDEDGIPRYCWYCGAKMRKGDAE